MQKSILFSLFFILLLSACSTKRVYEPAVLDSSWKNYEKSSSEIIDTSKNIALLEDRTVLTKDGMIPLSISETHRAISYSDGWVISGSIDGNLTIISKNDINNTKNIDLKKTVATATLHGDALAVVFADNEIAIYDMNTKAVLFKEQGSKYIAADSRIVPPHYMNGLFFFATLDGKVVIVNTKLKKRLRTIIVSSEDNFNNIIAMRFVNSKIVAATGYEIIAMAQKELRVKYEIRNIIFDGDTIYVATKQGEIFALNEHLELIKKVKFPFAHFYGVIEKNGKLYILEKEGFMIVLDKESFEYNVHKFTLQTLIKTENSKVYNDFLESNHFTPIPISISLEDAYIFVTDDIFYINDKKIVLK